MTNADKIRNMSDEELAETYINVVKFASPFGYQEVYNPKHSNELWLDKSGAIEFELEWLRKEAKYTPKELIDALIRGDNERNRDDEERKIADEIIRSYFGQ